MIFTVLTGIEVYMFSGGGCFCFVHPSLVVSNIWYIFCMMKIKSKFFDDGKMETDGLFM